MSRSTLGGDDAQYSSGSTGNLGNTGADAELDRDGVLTQLNSLLRGAISATETYRIALDKVADSDNPAHVSVLRDMQEEHVRACQALRDRIRELGGEPSESSGAWGVWAKTVTSVGSLFGNTSALKALKEGEEHGLKDYDEALDDVDATTADLIRNQLIPAQQRHIGMLDRMMGA